jgi:preprotein translocase subunit Sec61beta
VTVLEKSARNQLDKAVQAARRAATAGADRALRALAVDQEKKPAYLTSEQSELRRRLRVRCRGLGSWQDLVRAVAYEQWHRMLFARFLAENGLLIHPEYRAPVTLEECAEIARARGLDQWEVAAEYAAGMLPGIFQQDDPLLLLKYAPEDRAALQEILAGIPAETFRAQDALGWTYQFWQTEEKATVNKSGRKIEGADICAVTQLFTEPYMVQFLLQNTLGAWWLDRHPESPLRAGWVYYKDQVQHDFSAFPATAGDLKILDPACGSGHFLVEAFHMLLAMRQEEGESLEAAIAGIVRDNLHGLEIDPRCIQIAGFAVAMEAWKAGFPTDDYLPLPNLACVGLPIRAEKEEWLKLAGGDGLLEGELEKYYDLFKNADSLGSLIQIEEGGTLVPGEVLMQKLEKALAKEKATGDPVAEAFGETASGVLKAVHYLRKKDFHIVVTNPPFLGYRKQIKILQDYCEQKYPHSNADLATSFFERCNSFVRPYGQYGLVTPQNWLYLTTYEILRTTYLHNQMFGTVARLGANAFETIGGSVVQVALITLANTHPKEESIFLFSDLLATKSTIEKSTELKENFKEIHQKDQLKNPDARIGLDADLSCSKTLDNFCYSAQGIGTTDNPHFVIKFWEIAEINGDWVYFQTANKTNSLIGGYHSLLRWGSEYFDYINLLKSQNRIGGGWQAGRLAWGHKGYAINVTGSKYVTIYSGCKFDTTIGVVIPREERYLAAIYRYITSTEYIDNLLKIDPTLSITEGTLIKVPFDLSYWQKVADEMGPLPEPHSDDPTQWLFKGNIAGSELPLHVAIARMLGYRWPEQPADDPLDALADQDGIVCIPPVWGERPAVELLRSILAAAYGDEWSPRKEEELLRQAGCTKTGGLEGFLRDEFFASHCKLFHHRPFVWQVWDGTKDGFSVLLNYHKLNRRTLEKLIYTYLGNNWISQQKDEVRQEKPGAERRLAAAEALKAKLEQILEGEPPYDIYVRWKPLHDQAVGWEPDLNDGVRMNIRPFMEAGVLRWKPNIKWGKDRGTDPVPNCSGTTERLNDLHFTLEEKQRARQNAGRIETEDQ